MLKRVVCVLLAVCGVFSCTMVAYAADESDTWEYSFQFELEDIVRSDSGTVEWNIGLVNDLLKGVYTIDEDNISSTELSVYNEFKTKFSSMKYYSIMIDSTFFENPQMHFNAGTAPTELIINIDIWGGELLEPSGKGTGWLTYDTQNFPAHGTITFNNSSMSKAYKYRIYLYGDGTKYSTLSFKYVAYNQNASSVSCFNGYHIRNYARYRGRSNFSIDASMSSLSVDKTNPYMDRAFVNGVPSIVGAVEDNDNGDNGAYVQWSSWGNAVTTEGQYINVAYPASITYNLFTRGDVGHKYALAIREYDEFDQPGDIVYHCLIPVKEEMKPNKKYTIKQFFNTNSLMRNLNKGQKYVLHCLDLTTSEYVGSVGFIPGSNVECLPTIPQGSMDSWWFEDSDLGPGETPTDPPIGSADDIFQPPNLPNGEGGSNNGGGAGVGGIIDNVGNFFNGVISVFTEIGDGLGQLATTMSTSITTLTGVGGQFKGFLASAVPFIPPEIMTLIGLGLTLSILAMVVKVFR